MSETEEQKNRTAENEDKEPNTSSLPSEIGTIRIANEVVAVIAGLAATEVEGVAGMSGGIAGGIAEALGKKNLSRGVKVEVGEEETIVDIFLIVHYGVRIPDIAFAVQERVKNAIEKMTGLRVLKVNIHVQGVLFPSKRTSADSEEREGINLK